jgi:hypothetical protein
MKPSLVAAAAAGALMLATCAVGRAVTTEVLLRSGDVGNDGIPLAGFEDPAGTGGIAFRGTSAALMSHHGDGFAVLLRTGDPLPAPLSGTFAGFATPVINDAGAVLFRATGAAAASVDGLFLYDAGTVTVVTAQANGELRGFDLSNTGHVAFSDDAGVWLWTGGGGAPTSIVARGAPAPGGGTFGNVGRPLLNAADAVVFRAAVSDAESAMFTWRPDAGVSRIADSSFRSAAINASGQIALASTREIVRFDPADASTTVIALRSSAGLGAFRSFDPEFVGIDSAGNVAFEIVLSSAGRARIVRAAGGTYAPLSAEIRRTARDFSPRLTDTGHVVWRLGPRIYRNDLERALLLPSDATPFGRDVAGGAPSLNASDVVAFVATRGTLYRLDGSTVRRIAQADDALPSGEMITHIGPYAASGPAVAFLADTSAKRTVVLVGQNGSLRQVAAAHDAVPPRGRLELDDTAPIDVRGRGALFTASIASKRGTRNGVFVATPGGGPRLLVRAGSSNAGRFRYDTVYQAVAAGQDVAFTANLRGGPFGLFLVRASGTARIVAEGETLPSSNHRVYAIDSFCAGPGRVLFVAQADDEPKTPGIFLWRNGRSEKLLLAGEPLPGGGLAADAFGAIAVGTDAQAFVESDVGATSVAAIYQARGGVLTRLVSVGDPSPLGGTIASLDPSDSIAFRGNAVVYAATLKGASAPAALLATRP